MRKMFLYAVFAVTASLLAAQAPQPAKAPQAPQPAPAHPYFDLSGSFFRTISNSTSGHGTVQTPTDGMGGLFEFRYIHSTYIGGEIAYSWNKADQSYKPTATNCGLFCNATPESVKANANQLGFNWIFSKTHGNLRPFGVAGIGFNMTVPPGTEYAVNTAVKPAFIFGGGADWALTPRFGVRAQIRENLFSAPNATFAFPATGRMESVLDPTIGVYFRP